VASPAAVVVDGKVFLFYEGGDGAGIGLYTARGTRAATQGDFDPAGDSPLFAVADLKDPEHWVAQDRMGAPWPVLHRTALGDRQLRLFFAANGREKTAPRDEDTGKIPMNRSIGVAIGSIPANGADAEIAYELWPFNPVLAGLESLAPLVEDEPSVVRHGEQWRMYHQSEDGLVLATNPPP
jgi:hypothetical protein